MNNDIPARAATRLLLQQPLYSLRFDIMRLKFDKSIIFDTFQHFCATTPSSLSDLMHCSDTRDGLTLRRRTGDTMHYVILYNGSCRSQWRLRFTIAHELGHIYLGHEADGEAQEREANAFAAQLLLPRVLVEQLSHSWQGALCPDDLCEVFGASRSAAEHRLRSLKTPVQYAQEDYALLQRFCSLLPHPAEPPVTV